MRAVSLSIVGLTFLSPAGAPGQTVGDDRVFININAVHQCCVQNRSYAYWLSEPVPGGASDEAAAHDVRSRLGGAAARDMGGSVRLWRNLAVGFDVSTFRTQSSAEVLRPDRIVNYVVPPDASVAQLRDLEHRQVGYHLRVAWIVRLPDRFEVTAFGGPSHFRVDYESLTYARVGDEARPSMAKRPAARGLIGRNFGFDFSFLVTERLGVRILVRIAEASAIRPTRGSSESVRLGGSHLGIGLRLRF